MPLTADITTRALVVTADGAGKVYDGTATATATLRDNRVPGDELTVDYFSASFADKKVGPDKTVTVTGITVDGFDKDNYTHNQTASTKATITTRPLGVTWTGKNKPYDGNTAAEVTHVDDGVGGVLLDIIRPRLLRCPNVGTASR
jgi:hypothetical protein